MYLVKTFFERREPLTLRFKSTQQAYNEFRGRCGLPGISRVELWELGELLRSWERPRDGESRKEKQTKEKRATHAKKARMYQRLFGKEAKK